MPIGKISQTAGKGGDYSSGSTNISHAVSQSGGKTEKGYQKTSSEHSYGAGAVNIKATTDVPKVQENLTYSKSELSGQSGYGAGAMGMEQVKNAPKVKHESLGQIDKTKEMVHQT